MVPQVFSCSVTHVRVNIITLGLRRSFRLSHCSLSDCTGFRPTRTVSTSRRQSTMKKWRHCLFLTQYRVHRPCSGKQFLEASRLKDLSGDDDTSFSASCSSWTLSNYRPITFGNISSPSNGVASRHQNQRSSTLSFTWVVPLWSLVPVVPSTR